MGRRSFGACVLLIGALAAPANAAPEDVRALEKQLADEVSSLSVSDCNLACRALASIRRSAERICALEPGPRCDAARAKEAEAARRVAEACPPCAVAGAAPADKDELEAREVTAPTTALAGRPEPRGGCRSCTTASGPSQLDPSGWLLAAWTVWRCRRPSKKNRRQP